MSRELAVIAPDALTTQSARRAALAELNAAAEQAATPEEAREIMVKAKAIGDILAQLRAPFEESWMAGKASVLAARRLGVLLAELSPDREPFRIGPSFAGSKESERGRAMRELGLNRSYGNVFIRIAESDGPEFQRYVQSREHIPSVNGALVACSSRRRPHKKQTGRLQHRRNRAGVIRAKHPSVDEAHSLIVRALGHMDGLASGGRKGIDPRIIGRAMDALYEAEDLLKPYRGGYAR